MDGICSVWILTKTRGTPEEIAALNQAMHLAVVVLMQCSLASGINRMEVTTEQHWSGRYVPTFIFQSYFIPVLLNPLPCMFTALLLISAKLETKHGLVHDCKSFEN